MPKPAADRQMSAEHSLNRLSAKLPASLQQEVDACLKEWKQKDKPRLLWRRDASLWTGGAEAKWLGWLDIVGEELAQAKRIQLLATDVRVANFRHAVLLGMGGSSLGAEVYATSFGAQPDHPQLLVLDSTDPGEIAAIENAIDISRTLFIVSSKSGTTLEPDILKAHFFARAKAALGDSASAHFIAITDPGSQLESAARAERFRHICYGKADIGGRYSVLSDFGLVPAAVLGLDIAKFLKTTVPMVQACGPDRTPGENPGVWLGAILGMLALQGRDKLTIIASPGIAGIGGWLEQLVAESTGKQGKGIIPVDGEELGPPESYGADRVFVYLRLDDGFDAKADAGVLRLEQAGQPVVRIALADPLHLGQEFFRWEIATAVMGAILGIDPFDQPDVEASKIKTRELTQAYEKDGALPPETPLFSEAGIQVFADAANAKRLKTAKDTTLANVLRAHLGRLSDGDYVALLAYIARNNRHNDALQNIRRTIRARSRAATCIGFGPRFLHSTGQAYKGGPASGVFLQITADAAHLPVPGRKVDFGAVIAAQARGDLAVLNERGRRALRVHLGADIETGLKRLAEAVRQALG